MYSMSWSIAITIMSAMESPCIKSVDEFVFSWTGYSLGLRWCDMIPLSDSVAMGDAVWSSLSLEIKMSQGPVPSLQSANPTTTDQRFIMLRFQLQSFGCPLLLLINAQPGNPNYLHPDCSKPSLPSPGRLANVLNVRVNKVRKAKLTDDKKAKNGQNRYHQKSNCPSILSGFV